MLHIQEFLKCLPKAEFCITYGSSYLKASNGIDPKAQIDLIIGVDNEHNWHSENLKANPPHYSYQSRFFGSNFIVKSANKAAGIHYNPYVEYSGLIYKYGVISKNEIIEDLMN